MAAPRRVYMRPGVLFALAVLVIFSLFSFIARNSIRSRFGAFELGGHPLLQGDEYYYDEALDDGHDEAAPKVSVVTDDGPRPQQSAQSLVAFSELLQRKVGDSFDAYAVAMSYEQEIPPCDCSLPARLILQLHY